MMTEKDIRQIVYETVRLKASLELLEDEVRSAIRLGLDSYWLDYVVLQRKSECGQDVKS